MEAGEARAGTCVASEIRWKGRLMTPEARTSEVLPLPPGSRGESSRHVVRPLKQPCGETPHGDRTQLPCHPRAHLGSKSSHPEPACS